MFAATHFLLSALLLLYGQSLAQAYVCCINYETSASLVYDTSLYSSTCSALDNQAGAYSVYTKEYNCIYLETFYSCATLVSRGQLAGPYKTCSESDLSSIYSQLSQEEGYAPSSFMSAVANLQPPSGNNSSDNTAAIAGGVAAGIVVLLASLAGLYICIRRKKRGPVFQKSKAASFNAGNAVSNNAPPHIRRANDIFQTQSTDASTGVSTGSQLGTGHKLQTWGKSSASTGTHSRSVSSKSASSTPLADVSVLHGRSNSGAQSQPQHLTLTFESGASARAFAEAEANRNLEEAWKIDPSQLKMKLRNNEPIILGSGGFGSVYLGLLYGLTEVAVKVMTRPSQEHQARFEREIMTLKACLHPKIVQFMGASVRDQTTLLLVMQYMPGGTLYERIAADRAGELKWYKKGRSIALDISDGLNYLHSLQIIHLDIKSPNVLLSAGLEAKISDVGLGKALVGHDVIATQGASFMWAAPEQLSGRPCSRASDIFALGTVLWEICTGEVPVNRQCRPLEVPREAPQVVADVIERCRLEDSYKRPSIQDVYNWLAATPES